MKSLGMFRVAVLHNYYAERGGEDSVVESELQLLSDRGHEVRLVRRDNSQEVSSGYAQAFSALWSRRSVAQLDAEYSKGPFDVLHVHNTWPLVSPSVFWWAKKRNITTVLTLHNFRLNCLNALYLRKGRICEDCVPGLPWRGVAHRCYRNSVAASAVLAANISLHRTIGTYQNCVDRFIALNEFCRQKFIEGGLPGNKIGIKPNFVEDMAPPRTPSDHFLYVGRLSQEKGISVLREALLRQPDVRLRVVGEGPLKAMLDLPNVTLLGRQSLDFVRKEMASAMALIVPSIWYENFPRTIVEAFSAGLPVICSEVGALPEIVNNQIVGLTFRAGDSVDLLRAVETMRIPGSAARMSTSAREKYVQLYSPERNYFRLMEIYREARLGKHNSASGSF